MESLRALRQFVPKFYSCTAGGSMVTLEIENLLYNSPNANIMDVKLGTNVITKFKAA